ncbi:biopolymer transporter ExbD [Aquabacterium sp. A08]|uniref:biopolymer transporter ExbD n=1 Tax=Aquabacterium sp. A08 TaxID=2718532 RepID=UPI001421EE38|nr:biopolymer transporter ExbD [Aquabacterium sp. A08]NIC41549.1 protein TolR [Aquabacterium sp. A08]NIC42073.1 protein TolR [Aquabacterium sp. A08]NIC42122.1 protein TolR [Aquabacterium sp. A08]
MPALASRGKGRRTMNDINMVPFIDVMLVLLIIFMVTAPMLAPSQIELPSVGKSAAPPKRFVEVLIDKEGRTAVKEGGSPGPGEPVTAANLVGRVQALQGTPAAGEGPAPVIISADKAVQYEVVVQAMNALQVAGVARVGLSVQPGR